MSPANPGMDVANPGYKDVQTPRIHANWMPATRSVGATRGRRLIQGWMLPIHAGMTITFVTACSKTWNSSQPLSIKPLAPDYR